MRILVLGTGMQGKAAIYHLATSPGVTEVVAADQNLEDLNRFLSGFKTGNIRAVGLNAEDHDQVKKTLVGVEAAIVLLPPEYRLPMVRLAVEHGVHVVDASYALPEYRDLEHLAQARKIAILPECGLDPGIDLVIVGSALKEFDEIHTLNVYGAGVPEVAAATNPLKYKISWTFEGVLRAYTRPARILRDGEVVEIPGDQIFSPENIHRVAVEGVGELEAYPNGDAVKFIDLAGIRDSAVNAGRYSMRWPGHSAFWGPLVGLGLLSNEPVRLGNVSIIPHQFIYQMLEPQLQYGPAEKDVAVVLVDIEGIKNGQRSHIIYQILDTRDPETGFFAMQRTVGYTASICAQMILRGDIPGTGLLSPMLDIPPGPFFQELGRRGLILKLREAK